jgi:DNA-binding NtrC family response regulator
MKTILLIDDCESYQFLLQEELSEEGYEVITASRVEDVLSESKGIKPDLLILELRQRDVKEETFEKIRELYPHIPLIGHSTLVQCPSEFQKWMNFYISKSSETDGIKELIRSL